MKIHKEGYHILGVSTLALAVFNLLVYYFIRDSFVFYAFFGLTVTFYLIVLNFFRSPSRSLPNPAPGSVVAPADGTIVVIEEVMENEYFQEKRLQVSIFMSLFNAHVNWIPVEGKIKHYTHQNGRFMAAYLPKSSTENERSTIVIECENGEEILVRQIAGAMAKRIVTYAEVGKDCHINDQMGFIKFGSRVDLFLPLNSDILVSIDDKVCGNRTQIAQIN